jgi:PIN domain nuclease of toxin-antitoxin system
MPEMSTANPTKMNKPAPLLLDTHIWLRYQGISGDLRPSALPAIHRAAEANLVFISVISIWEIALLVRLNRITLHTSVDRWSTEALSKPGINLLPLTPQIAIASVDLPEPMHKDPADRILVASARIERLTLVTRDRDILSYAKATKLACLQA